MSATETTQQSARDVTRVELEAIIWLCRNQPNYRPPRDRVAAIAELLLQAMPQST